MLLTDTLQLQINASYTDSTMTSDVPSLGAEDGDDMTMVPSYNFYVALDQQVVLFKRDGSVRLDVAGYGEYKSSFNADPDEIASAHEIVGLAGSLQVNDNARIGININNLLNEETSSYEGGSYILYGDERSIAVRFDFEF